MNRQITLFDLFGFKVRLHGSWIFLALLVAWSLAMGYFPQIQSGLSTATYWAMGLIGVAGLFVSIVFHEFFHSLVARHYRLPMRGITLFIFGGIAEMSDEPPSPKAEGFMAIAGPLSSLLLWGLFGVLAGIGASQEWPVPLTAVLGYLSQINLILAAFNMIPAFPLDGGRVLRAVLWAVKKDVLWATLWAARLGAVFGVFLIVLGVIGVFYGQFLASVWWILIGFFINQASKMAQMQTVIKEGLKGESLARFIDAQAPVLLPNQSVETALNRFFYPHRQRFFPVVENGYLVGCLSTVQIRQIPPQKRSDASVREIMVKCSDGHFIRMGESAYSAYKKMTQNNLKHLIVVDEHDLFEGMISREDLSEFLALKMEIEDTQFSKAA